MILTCPECKSRYVVNPSALMPRGRTVRCAKCRHSWFESKPDDGVEIVTPTSVEPQNAAAEENETATAEPATENTETGPEANNDINEFPFNQPKKRQRPIPKGSNLPALQNQKYGSNKVGWVSLVVFVTAVISAFLIFQETIVSSWPATNKLYTAIGLNNETNPDNLIEPQQIPINELLVVGGLEPRIEQENNVSHLYIKGYIENISTDTQTIPSLIATLKDATGQSLRSWNFSALTDLINPGERVTFETSLPNPPSQARDISVSIVDSR